jgi:Family of unknown function (DUF6433)
MRKSVAEILEEIAALKKKEDKITKLRENVSNTVMLKILQWTYDQRIKWLLPEGEVPYNPTKYLDQEGNLYNEARRLYLFVEGGNPNLKQIRREFLFIQLLETLSPKEAQLLASVKDKKLPYKGITEKLVQEAFPGLINEAALI